MDLPTKKWPGVLGTIGGTPLVELRRLCPNPKVKLLAKIEARNPGGSVKDRIALAMIEAAEQSGELTHQKIILEPTSGNTGIGLALVGAAKGYRVVLAMSEGVSIERRKILSALGATFLLTPAEKGTDGAIELAYEMAAKEKEKYFLPDQFNNPANIEAHYHGTGVEIWNQTEGKVTHFVATMGTTGTLMGVSRRLHEMNPAIKIIGVEPYLGHKIQGLKNMKEAYRPGIYNPSLLDEKVNVEDEAAYETARELARKEGIFAGMSAGAAVWAAQELARKLEGGVIVVLLPDGGERYLSTPLFQVPEEMMREEKEAGLRFFNTLTHRYEAFEPIDRKEVKIYSCGPTLDSEMHLGGLRRLLVADILRRWLEVRGYKVRHVMNMTDLDDRTVGEAERRGMELGELTSMMERRFFEDLDALRVRRADAYPRASEHVAQMVALTEKLVAAGFAYEKFKNVYFDISKKNDYGKLSGFDLGKIRVGATVDLDSYEKDSPADFTLIKRSTLAEIKKGISYKSRWGNVRPGWHVECAAMALQYLGDQFDIHTSSVDLIFPHHENEIAICESITGKPPARYWLHSELALYKGKKVSRERGGAVTLKSLADHGWSPRIVRYYILSVHYRQPLSFCPAALEAARASLERIDIFTRRMRETAHQQQCGPVEAAKSKGGGDEGKNSLVADRIEELKQSFRAAMDDDLNVSVALASIFTFIRRMNTLADERAVSPEAAQATLEALKELDSVLGFILPWEKEERAAEEDDWTYEIEKLVKLREEARKAKDWSRADTFREELSKMGVIVEDTPEGPRWRRK